MPASETSEGRERRAAVAPGARVIVRERLSTDPSDEGANLSVHAAFATGDGPSERATPFPGEAAVYMGIVHVAIYDAAVLIDAGYEAYAPTPVALANSSPRGRDRNRSLRDA